MVEAMGARRLSESSQCKAPRPFGLENVALLVLRQILST